LFYYRTDDLFDIHIHANVNVVYKNSATQGSVVVGANGVGGQANQLHGPMGLSFDRQNNLYVVEQMNCRTQKFDLDQNSN
jgi:hypothetical protein